jgi:hypothetical protein
VATAAAKRAYELVGPKQPPTTGTDVSLGHDALLAAARLWRHAPAAVPVELRARLDAAAAEPNTADPHPRLAWWGARAERLLGEARTPALQAEARGVLEQLSTLSGALAPVAALGKAALAGSQLAVALGDDETARRLDATRIEAARAARRLEAAVGSGTSSARRSSPGRPSTWSSWSARSESAAAFAPCSTACST